MTSAALHPRTLTQRVRFVIVGALLILVPLLIALPFLAGVTFMAGLTAGVCGGAETLPPGFMVEDAAIPNFRGGTTAGYLITGAEPRTGATVMMAPTLGSGRGYRAFEYVHYLNAGYDVLTFDSVNCTGLTVNSLGYSEVPQIADALAWLENRGADMTRIGLHGFSAGGALGIMAAVRYPQIGAVVAQGHYHDLYAHMRDSTGAAGVYGVLFDAGALLGYRVITGQPIDVLSPVNAIADIAPRPVLLIYGSTEPALYGAFLQQAAGGSSVTVWTIPGASHGDYALVAPDEYPRRIVAFMDAAFGIVR